MRNPSKNTLKRRARSDMYFKVDKPNMGIIRKYRFKENDIFILAMQNEAANH